MDFDNILDEAHLAASAAALKAEAEATTWFPCGFAWVTVGGNTALARHCRKRRKENGTELYGAKGYPRGWTWWCPGGAATQRMETHKAASKAFAEVLRKHGIDATVGSRMD